MKKRLHPRSIIQTLREFMQIEAAGGILLMGAAAAAMLVANTALGDGYFAVKATYLGPLTVDYWINDGLMALFFLLVGLEIKREFIEGQLSTGASRILPALAAGAGVAVPAIIYMLVAGGATSAASCSCTSAASGSNFPPSSHRIIGHRSPRSFLSRGISSVISLSNEKPSSSDPAFG